MFSRTTVPSTLGINVVEPRSTEMPRLDVEAIANELKETGVTVTVLCPGPTQTGFAERAGMLQSNMFTNPNVMPASRVAEAGYRGMKRGKAIVIPGLANKLLIQSLRISPRWAIRMITRWFQEGRKEQ